MGLQDNVLKLKGIGAKRAQLLEKLAINTVSDLLKFYPKQSSYTFLENIVPLKTAENYQTALFLTNVVGIQNRQSRQRLKYTNIIVKDSSGYAEILLFASQTYQAKILKPGDNILIIAKAEWQHGKLTLKNAIINKHFNVEEFFGVLTKYKLVKGLTQKQLQQAIKSALQVYKKNYSESLPIKICKDFGLISLEQAIENIHFPQNRNLLQSAQYRLIFEELFFLQYSLFEQKQQQENKSSVVLNKNDYAKNLLKKLPFELTVAQKNVWQDIKNDFQAKKCMQRLIQGDVGSGKTIIAILTILTAVENGYQAVIIAPTEILARQHYNYFQTLLAEFALKIEFLSSSVLASKRTRILEELRNNKINILVGTHSILNEQVQFAKLALGIIDEQHRFGVLQRQCLLAKNQISTPHLLVMSATPIPRTLALALYGNLEVSRIESMPEGRKPVKTLLYTLEMRDKIYQGACRQLALGRQVYVVCPLIEGEDEEEEISSVLKTHKFLKEKYFSKYNCAILHGKLASKEKDKVMLGFITGEIQILISTTVIEVGINVPNASLMIIENAEFFGLAQLHQLRGRVGRGSEQSYCVLLSESSKQDSWERLELMVKYTDGFKLAEEDLRLRGAGEMLGEQQHGLSDFLMADIIRDSELILRISSYLQNNKDNLELFEALQKSKLNSFVTQEFFQRLN